MKTFVWVLSIVLGMGVMVAEAQALPGIGNVTGTKTEAVVKDVGKMVVVNELNKSLAAEAKKCGCDEKTDTVASSCDYSAIAKKVNDVRTGLKAALNRDANLKVTAPTQGCASRISSQVTGWWYWNTRIGSSVQLHAE